jgi:hypothetical protein
MSHFLIGAAKVRIIFKSPNLFAKIFQFLFLRQSFNELLCHPFFEWECKGTTFLFTSKFITDPKRYFFYQNIPTNSQQAENQERITTLQFC